jgi:holo-[acyl-carrier protein] synthase
MIFGIGIDLVEIDRITRSFQKGDGFKNLVFSEEEQQLCDQKANPFESYAARFAAKEAFLKALETGMELTIELNQIEILSSDKDVPYIRLSETLLPLVKKRVSEQNFKILVSLTHTKHQASAVVLIEIVQK